MKSGKECLLVLLSVAAVSAQSPYVVDQDLGDATNTTTTVSGDTSAAGGTIRDSARYHSGVTNTAGNWGNERVYQFVLTEPSYIELESVSVTGDPDFFLLDGLGTAISSTNGKAYATGGLAAAFLDGTPPIFEDFGGYPAGTYYLVVEHFLGFDGAVAAGDSQFEIKMNISPASALDLVTFLGLVGAEGEPISIDTSGSAIDTVMAIYDQDGMLLDTNDDGGTDTTSLLDFPGGLTPGFYYVAVSGSGTLFDEFWSFTAGDTDGDIVFNFPYGTNYLPGSETFTLDTAFDATAVKFYAFEIATKPTDVVDLGEIAAEGEPIDFDLANSNFDTQIALFDANGYFWDFNDDYDFAGGDYTSYLPIPDGLFAGQWYLAIAGWAGDNDYGDGFVALTGSTSEGGDFELAYAGTSVTSSIAIGEVTWYSFTIGEFVAPAEDLAISSVSVDGTAGTITLAWTPITGATYAIQSSATGNGDFANVTGQTGLTGTTATFAIDTATNPILLFRVIEE